MSKPDQRETAAPAVGTPLDCRVGRPVPERSNRHLLTPDMIAAEDAAGGVVAVGALARLATGEAMTEGELWSWVRSVMCQGADICTDYDRGVHKGYEAYSARLDMAAAERADQLLARLKTPISVPSEVIAAADAPLRGALARELAKIRRRERGPLPGADWVADMRARLERPCCGTLHGSRHRATCPNSKTPNPGST